MEVPFTKMHGAGNDFVVLDETAGAFGLRPDQYRWLADRHFGIGADQILSVRASPAPGVDFAYVIHNADGGQVEHCGNGARCFLRFVRERGLTDKTVVRVQTLNRLLELREQADGRVTVDMGRPEFALDQVPFDATGLQPQPLGDWLQWPLTLADPAKDATVLIATLSMGNPHAVLQVASAEQAPVERLGPLIESHARFPQRVNAGFMEVQARDRIRLRVYERGAGETLACGTGACAAVVAGIRLGLLDARVDVQTHGGLLTIEWAGGGAPVLLTGPAVSVYRGRAYVPD